MKKFRAELKENANLETIDVIVIDSVGLTWGNHCDVAMIYYEVDSGRMGKTQPENLKYSYLNEE